MRLKAEQWTLEGFIADLEELAKDYEASKNTSPEYDAFMTSAALLRDLERYRAIGPVDELVRIHGIGYAREKSGNEKACRIREHAAIHQRKEPSAILITDNLIEAAEMFEAIAKGELVRVVRCEECALMDTINCYGSHSTDYGTGWFTPRMLNGCLNGERKQP